MNKKKFEHHFINHSPYPTGPTARKWGQPPLATTKLCSKTDQTQLIFKKTGIFSLYHP